MTDSNVFTAYQDCVELFNRALASKAGLRVSMESESSAMKAINRLHTTRSLDRIENMKIYPPDAPEYGTSEWDSLVVRRPRFTDGRWWVYIEYREVLGIVEELPGAAE